MNTLFNYIRRKSSTVHIGSIPLGSDYPIRIQSMTSTSTLDTEQSVAQTMRIADAGAHYVRLTAQGIREADNIGHIRSILREKGYNVPLVADIHFNPKAAFAAAKVTDKVRINPGNFVDAARTFKKIDYTDCEYKNELQRIEDTLIPFIELCREHGTAVRLGVNHGSLSDRIMSRYGDTPAGMVESAMEFLRVFVKHDFNEVAISIKASNTVIMVETVRRLIKAMDAEGMHFPLHLGVTEAGDGEDGRIKSAVGIGTLLAEGIGDTIRVSLSEAPELEIPVASTLVKYITSRMGHAPIQGDFAPGYNPVIPSRRVSDPVGCIGGTQQPVVIASTSPHTISEGMRPDFFFSHNGIIEDPSQNYIVPIEYYSGNPATSPIFSLNQIDLLKSCNAPAKWLHIDSADQLPVDLLKSEKDIIIALSTSHSNPTGAMQAMLHTLMIENITSPVVLWLKYNDSDNETLQIKAAADFGTMLLNGFRDGIWLDAPEVKDKNDIVRYEFGILQAARLRTSKTEFISCPGCGRTLFNLQNTIKEVKSATSHLKHLKIGIMGCIVNGPGEMADADYGYVGAAAHRISLYKGKECMEKNIPEEEAIPRLIALIKTNNDWIEP